jgi:hypothetical protein
VARWNTRRQLFLPPIPVQRVPLQFLEFWGLFCKFELFNVILNFCNLYCGCKKGKEKEKRRKAKNKKKTK